MMVLKEKEMVLTFCETNTLQYNVYNLFIIGSVHTKSDKNLETSSFLKKDILQLYTLFKLALMLTSTCSGSKA